MTAIKHDGFDHYGPGAFGSARMLDGNWAEVSAIGPGVPSWGTRTGAYALTNDNGAHPYRYVLPATKGRLFFSCGFSLDGLPSLDLKNDVIRFLTAANAGIAQVFVQSTGAIVLVGPAGTVLASTQGPVIRSRTWHFLEMDFDQAAGKFTLRVDDPTGAGTPAIAATGIALGANPVGQLSIINIPVIPIGNVQPWMDDFYLRDTSGAVNNSWLGDRRIATLLVSADTAVAGFTPRYYHDIGAGILNDTAANACVSAATATSLNVGNGEFTLETFVRFQSLPSGSNKAVIFSRWDQTANQRSYQLFLGSVALNAGCLCFQTSTDGTVSTAAQPIVYPFTPDLDVWYHIAMVRAAGELLLFVNGQQLGLPIADATTYFAGAAPYALGGQQESGGTTASTTVTGWLDEHRFTVGYARYTANFTPTVVPFPRGSGSDAHWANVALLAGFDSLIQDESSFARALTARNGAVQQTVSDGPVVGVWSTMGKAVPDDNTFAEAPLIPASSILTLNAQPANNDTVTVGTKAGPAAAVYTFKAALSGAFQVLIDTTLQQTLQNLYNAINAGPGVGTKYGTATTANLDVAASQLPAGQMAVTANVAGTAGNAIASTVSLTNGGGWTGATLAGGVNIPGPSDFKMQRPPPLTTIISSIEPVFRGFKSDAGLASVNDGFVGPLGAVTSAAAHSLTVNPSYYSDIYELDPDTGAAITPATLINGAVRINRAT